MGLGTYTWGPHVLEHRNYFKDRYIPVSVQQSLPPKLPLKFLGDKLYKQIGYKYRSTYLFYFHRINQLQREVNKEEWKDEG